MNGAEAILKTLIAGGIDVCFANPGTSEMHFVSALDRIEGMRCVLGLAETVVTGAADGYARIAEKPAVTLLHTGPGLANGLSNLHNARRAPVSIVNVVGDHATYHVKLDAPLASDIVGLAKPMSHWVRCIEIPARAGSDTADAIAASHEGAGRIATLILPADIAWSDNSAGESAPSVPPGTRAVDPAALTSAVAALRSGEPTMILLGGHLSRARLGKAAGVAAKYRARLARELFPTLLAHGRSVPTIEHMPYPPERMHAFMADIRNLILVGAAAPTTFFAYPGVTSSAVAAGCRLHVLAGHDDALDPALDALLRAAGSAQFETNVASSPVRSAGQVLNAVVIADVLSANMPRNAIVIEEAISSSPPLIAALSGADAHELLFASGGSIGWAIPAAVGAALAAPHRKVICLTGDGSALYSLQALWSLAREKLDVIVIVYANHDYSILKTEFDRVGAQAPGPRSRAMMNIESPTIDFTALATGYGVAATRVESADAFANALTAAVAAKGPVLIEAVIPGSMTGWVT